MSGNASRQVSQRAGSEMAEVDPVVTHATSITAAFHELWVVADAKFLGCMLVAEKTVKAVRLNTGCLGKLLQN